MRSNTLFPLKNQGSQLNPIPLIPLALSSEETELLKTQQSETEDIVADCW